MADSNPRIVLSATDKTGAAFATASRNLAALQGRAAGVSAALGPLLGSVGLLGSALSIVNFKAIVNGVDALNDLKDATGSSIENLSALEDVAARTGTSFDTVGTALVKFNAQLKEAKPGSGPAEVLKAIGLNAQELKRIDPAEALRRTAVALSVYADDGNKARIIQELFGKSVREVAPLLNDLATQGQLNATVTTAQAEAAEKFNQQMFALEKNIKDAARSLVGDMIPALNQFFAALEGNRKGGGFFASIGKEFKANLISDQLRVVVADVERLQAVIDQHGATPEIAKRMAELRAEAAALSAQATQASNALKGFADVAQPVKPRGRPANEGGGKFLGLKAPDVPGKLDTSAADKARAEALANLRKITDGRLKAIDESLDAERSLQRFHEQLSKALYDQGLQSLDKFHADQDAARQDNLASVRRAVDAEIAERQKLLSSPLLQGKDKLAERQEIENQIEDARAKLRKAERETQQAGQLAAVERQRDVQAVSDAVAQLDAQIQALKGNTAAGDLLDIARQVRDAQAELRKGGATDEQAQTRATELGALLEAQRQVNQARDNFATITRRASDEEERFLIVAQARGDSTLEVEQGLRTIRGQALAQMAEQLRLAEALANAAGPDSPAVQFARELRLEFGRLNAVADPALLRLRAVGDEVADALGKAAGAISLNVKDAKSALKSLGDQLLAISTRELIEKPLSDFFKKQIRGLTEGEGGLAGIAGKIFGVGAVNTANTVPGFAGGQFDVATGRRVDGGAGIGEVFKDITGLGAAAKGSSDVLGKLPQLAGIPATTAMASLSAAAQIASQALTQLAQSASAKPGSGLVGNIVGGAAGSSGIGSLGLGGLIGGGGGFGSGVNFGEQDLGLFLHKGGIAGVDGAATRYHSGGIAGRLPDLKPNEVPAILLAGEEVLTRGDPRHRANRGGGTVVNNVDLRGLTIQSHGQMDRMAEERSARNVARRAERYISRRGA